MLYPLLAEIAAASLRRAALLHQANQERRRLQHSLDITAAVGATVSLNETMERILAKLAELFPQATPCVLLYREEDGELEFAPASLRYYKVDNPAFVGQKRLAIDGKGLSAKVALRALETGKPILENAVDVDKDSDEYLPFVLDSRSQLSIALVSGGTLLGVLTLESNRPSAFSKDDVLLLTGIAQQITGAIERVNQGAQLRFKATVTSRTAWAAEIAHDISTAIGYIRNRTEWISTDSSAAEQVRQWAAEIDASANQLAGTVRSSASSAMQEKQPFELHQTVARWLADLVQAKQSNVVLVFESECEGVRIEANREILRRALNHIVRNALEAMGQDGKLFCIIRRLGDVRVEIRIADTGPGIPEEIGKYWV